MKIYEKAIKNYIEFSGKYYKELLRIARRKYKRDVRKMLSKGGCCILGCGRCPVNLARKYYSIEKCYEINNEDVRHILNLEVPDNANI